MANNGALPALAAAAGVVGNALEWYDFGLYGFFSDTIAKVFFPSSNSDDHNLILSYIVFGGAFLMRPVGGLVSGHIGDKYGRKRAVVHSLLTMSVSTMAMAFLPTYEQVGWLSTALLVICRMIQGFSVGGQLPSSLVYTLELRPKEHWGYYGSMFSLANNIGAILGNLVGALIRTLLTDEQLISWGWRLAFFTGFLIAPVTAVIHFYGVEHNPNEGEFGDPDETIVSGQGQGIMHSTSSSWKQTLPLNVALERKNWPALLAVFLTPMFAGAGYYITFVWMAVFMETLNDPPVAGAFWINLFTQISGGCWTSVLAGWLSDRYGRNKLMSAGAISLGILAPGLVWVISWGRTLHAFLAQWTIGVLLSLFTGPMYAWLSEKFPPKVRLTSASLGYNLGLCLSAGFSPAIATALVRDFGPVAPGLLYPFFAIVALIGLLVSTRVHQEGRIELTTPNLQPEFLRTSRVNLL